WGAPVLVGPRIDRSNEIGELIAAGGGFRITDFDQLKSIVMTLFDDTKRKDAAEKAEQFVKAGAGATEKIIGEIRAYL
ncbi:MAG TPA: 3-deoxy-D-manno-octulosonic acid transferase, partial [Candidatus Kapabacteria bacterium]|nr:3-deoxy-D-manno-octulosonic acid transferase [Candidatus Kapabacteria bacterium]